MFKFSQNRKQHSVSMLKQNHCKLLFDHDQDDSDHIHVQPTVVMQPDSDLVGRRIRHQFKL